MCGIKWAFLIFLFFRGFHYDYNKNKWYDSFNIKKNILCLKLIHIETILDLSEFIDDFNKHKSNLLES